MANDNKERQSGDTIEVQDQVKIEAVRSNIIEYVRVKKRLPSEEIQLDVRALTHIPDGSIIEVATEKENSNLQTSKGSSANAAIAIRQNLIDRKKTA